MTEENFLKQIYHLILESEAVPDCMPLDWASKILMMHRRGWLYCSMKGDELLAVAGAYRIPEWDERYQNDLPESEAGNVLYVPFIAAKGKNQISPLRLLKFCLRENPAVEEIVYWKKAQNKCVRRRVLRRQLEDAPAIA